MTEERLYRAIERIQDTQREHGEAFAAFAGRFEARVSAIEGKIDAGIAADERRDEILASHSKDIEQARGVTKLVGTLATSGFFGGLLALLKAYFGGGSPQ